MYIYRGVWGGGGGGGGGEGLPMLWLGHVVVSALHTPSLGTAESYAGM